MPIQSPHSPNDFLTGLVASFSMIIVSEIGDKTFLIAAIMSMTHGRAGVFAGACSALALMTILSTAFGVLFPHLLSRSLTSWIAAGLFGLFGVKMVRDGWKMAGDQMQAEYSQVAQELETDPAISPQALKAHNAESAIVVTESANSDGMIKYIGSILFWKVATLTFVAEWGDRSQIATIALAAAQDPLGVTIGAIAGHALCTLLAVMCGGLLAKQVSIRTVTVLGGMVFILFSALTSIGML